MQPLFAVHNNVSLLSINIAPSSFLAALIVAFIFLSLYLPRLPSLPRFLRFGRRTGKQETAVSDRSNKNSEVIVVQRHRYFVHTAQGLIEVEGIAQDNNNNGNGNDSYNVPVVPNQGFQFWRRPEDRPGRSGREVEYVDRRHRQLPPLPHSLQDVTLDDDTARGGSPHKKGANHSDGARPEKTRKADKETLRLKAKQQQKSTKSAKGSKSSSSTPAQSKAATAVSTELVVRRSKLHDNLTESQLAGNRVHDESSIDNSGAVESHTAGDNIDPTSWSPFSTAAGVFGRLFTAQARPGPEPSVDTASPTLGPNETDRRAMEASEIASETGPAIENESMFDSDSSAGGYSPPAWRRLENGDRSSGFWRKSDNILGSPTTSPPSSHRPPPTETNPLRMPLSTTPFQYQKRSALGISDASRFRASRESSPGFDSADDEIVNEILGFDDEEYPFPGLGGGYNPFAVTTDNVLEKAMRTRLPGSASPELERNPEPWFTGAENNINRNSITRGGSPDKYSNEMLIRQEPSDNYIRFVVRDEVQQHRNIATRALSYIRGQYYSVQQSWSNVVCSLLIGIMSLAIVRGMTQPAGLGLLPVPDLVKVAGVARSFEPLIYYSENAVAQVGDLQATGAAVWDLGESVRYSNLTSAPRIVKELDALSDTLNVLAMELTRFFTNVDSDIDGILIVMDWARRELAQLTDTPSDASSSSSSLSTSSSASLPPSASSSSSFVFRPLAAVYDHVHTLLSHVGLLENTTTGAPTAVGAVATTLFGMSGPQRTRSTLRRIFHEFLAVLEEAVSSELQHSLALFALFEAIDGQFLNLNRIVAREEGSVESARDAEKEASSTLLARLWTRLLGDSPASTAAARRYEQKRELLRSVRDKTLDNKNMLKLHNRRLLALKASLEGLRRKLVSPLVRSVSSSTLSLDEQIRGLEDAGGFLEGVRARQKGKLLEIMYGTGSVGQDNALD